MSYTIVYRAMFVKMSDGTFIPMIESGSSNVWDDNRRRARNWESWRWTFETQEQSRKYSLTEDEIMGLAQQEVDKQIAEHVGQQSYDPDKHLYTEAEIRENFDYFSGIKVNGHAVTSASQFLNFFKSGFRYAIPFCELKLSFWEGSKHRIEYATSEKVLAEKWAKAEAKPYVLMDSDRAETLWQEVKRQFARPRQEKGERYVIAVQWGLSIRYIADFKTHRASLTSSKSGAKTYACKGTAENTAEKILQRFRQISAAKVITA